MKNLNLISSFLFLFSIQVQSFSQETLQQKYNMLLEKTETFQQYKVIPKTTLDDFWSETMDSLNQANNAVNGLQLNVSSQEDSIQSLNTTIASIQENLDESLELNDTIDFLGIPFSKWGYHILVWLIIIVLAVLCVMAYLMFMRSNTMTTRYKRELVGLTSEFENHKDHAREKQMKLKRELQTAVNQLSERR